MTEKLLTFLFLGILLALGYHLALNLAYARYFTASAIFSRYWYWPFAVAPLLLLLGLGWVLGFFKRWGWADIAAFLIAAGLAFLTVPASYSCALGCF